VKRSHTITLVLLGGISAGAFSGCKSTDAPVCISPESVYANDYHVPGVGYYHAPFHRFFPLPYNHYDATLKQYYFGGQWAQIPFQSAINVSAPTPEAAQQAEAARTDITRGGFGSTSGGHGFYC
jgi:hypothetical protein